MALKPNQGKHFPPFLFHPTPFLFHPTPSFPSRKPTKTSLQSSPTRRTTLLSMLTSLIPKGEEANALDFRMTTPDQTVEEAENEIQFNAQRLLQVKELLNLEEWKEAQKELRRSSALLKQDMYTIIQDKPGIERPRLRELYSVLFNSVTGLDFAARGKDVTRVWKCYDNIVVALNDILSKL